MNTTESDFPDDIQRTWTLDELKDILISEIVPMARNGTLGRWFQSRELDELAESLAVLVAQNLEDVDLFLGVCELLESGAHRDDMDALVSLLPKAEFMLNQSLIAGRYQISADANQIMDHQTGLIYYRQKQASEP